MGFQLKKQTYDWRHFVIIPFQCEPVGTVILGAQKLMTALTNIFTVPVTAIFIDSAIKAAQGQLSATQVLPWLLLLLALVGWKRVSFNIGRVFTAKVRIKAEQELSQAFTDKRARIKYRYVEDPKAWDLVNRVCKDLQRAVSEMLQRTFNLIIYIIRIFGVLIIIFTQVWWVGILIMFLSVPLIVISMKSGKGTYSAHKTATKYERRHQYIAEVLSGREAADERALFSFSDHLNDYWFDQYETARKINLKAEIRWTLSTQAGSGITSLLSSVIVVALVWPTMSGQISYGMFIAIATAVYDLVKLMGWEMTRAITQLARYREYMKDFTELANLEEDPEATDLPLAEEQVFQSLEFRDVSFQYPGTERYILQNLNMKMEKGVHYAFVGANGSGKTTITKLITGLYDNYTGDILLNGKNIREISKARLKSIFCGVYQDFARYYVTAGENILLGDINHMNDDRSKQRMEHITKELDIYEPLKRLPKGFDTPLGKINEDGVDVSGGQWQRIAISRALMSPAPVKILDEPTAALDPVSESRLYGHFEQISRNKTTIFISHRLGSTKIADKIFVIGSGCVQEEGSHNELMALNGTYKEMYDSQRSWYQ